MTAGPRLAVNPIAYWLAGGTPDRSTATLGRAFSELAEIGYQAVKADVPYDMAADELPAVVAELRPGPGVEPLLRLVRRPGHPSPDGRRGSGFRRRPGRTRSAGAA